ncbi:hypothetical protein BH11PLA2_BH11PLA2_15120 [soil metagenome]
MTRYAMLILVVGSLSFPRLMAQSSVEPKSVNAVTTALAFTQRYAFPAALVPGKDRDLKVKIIAGLGKASELPWDAVPDVFDKDAFQKWSGGTNAISLVTMEKLMKGIPLSRTNMNAKIRLHADLLSTQFDIISEAHREPAAELVNWIVKNYQAGQSLGVIIICTGNTRRSMLGATMGNVAAAYYGLPNIGFFSGGTEPDAFNLRTISTLKEIGLEIEATGQEATRGTKNHPNPIYAVKWGTGLETREFSKKYGDAQNPQKDFAAIMVCSEADASCPKVTGASIRIPAPYLDPKAFDGAPIEAGKYAERRDDMGRLMLSVMMQAHRRLELDGKLK